MNPNFNIVQKPKKDEGIEEEDELELEEEVKVKDNNDKAKKRMLTMMGVIVGGMIILLVILFICSLFVKKTYSYTELETLLKDAAISYFKDYPESLPTVEGNIVEIDSTNLVAAEKMKDLSEYTKEGVICSGTVQVEKAGTQYLYTPYLNCGENYTTQELYKKLTSDENVVSSGYGLYSFNGNYIYRGENVNNYLQLDNSLWRIVKITSNNNIVIINDTGVKYSKPWDDRYNEKDNYEAGFNNYSASRVKDYLDKIYDNPSQDDGEEILSANDKSKLVTYSMCIGKRDATSEKNDNSVECTEKVQDVRLGLLTLSDYIYASIDANCKNSLSRTCQNYNYLKLDSKSWWLITGDTKDNSKVYSVDGNGAVELKRAASYSVVRPVAYLNSKVLYKSGNGTLEKPYKIK